MNLLGVNGNYDGSMSIMAMGDEIVCEVGVGFACCFVLDFMRWWS
jgi:hypothetical protein